ncbi:unnamed protein product [Ectocarpus sp. CCAP 1310/34]|nr:unnamed protein product [Ectocarpus sp. CCAP 1310/34]
MSSSSPRINVAVAAPAAGIGMPHEDLGSEEFDGLLQPSVWDTLVDLGDFSCADLSGSNGTETQQQYKQQQPLPSPPKTSGRKRSLPQTSNWDNLGPKALSEISASLLAGGWDGGVNSSYSVSTSPHFLGPPAGAGGGGPSADSVAVPHTTSPCSRDDAAAASQVLVAAKQERAGGTAAPGGKGISSSSSKGRRGAVAGGVKVGSGAGAAGGKRPLNPDRMERKASREKRRREEVNEKFDQLLQVLEEAEATSGLEPPAAKDGKTAAHACINGRRVEVLSRTIQVVKKLLRERREALAGVPPPADDTLAAVAAGISNGWQEETAEGPVLDGGFRSEVEENNNTAPLATETTAAAAAAAASTRDVIDSNEAAAEGADAQAEAAIAATMVAAPEGAAAKHHSVMHHVAMSVSGHHPSMMMAPGFTGVPGHPVPSPPHGIPGHPGGPIFFAVPMYIPQGQGMPPVAASTATTAAAEHAAQVPAATAVAAPSLAATSAAAADPAPTPMAEAAAVAAPGVVDATEAVPAPSGKKTWAVPAGMGYQSMMTLQMPQFVTQALSGEEGSEKPTHAVCA